MCLSVGAKAEEEEEEVQSGPTTKDARPGAQLNMTTEDYLDELCRRHRPDIRKMENSRRCLWTV